ncbi:MAG: TlpA family protein disulfide reductase [Bacteroidota bacterium]
MKRAKSSIYPIFLFLFLFAIGSTSKAQTAEATPPENMETEVEAPEVIKFDRLEHWFNTESDTLYVLNFWATWCRPCVAEMPYFEQVQKEMADQKVKVVFISMDFLEDMESRLLPFLERKQVASQVVLLDEPKYNTWIDKVSEEWSGAIPATVFVQKSKDIRLFHEGEYTYDELKAKVESLISK